MWLINVFRRAKDVITEIVSSKSHEVGRTERGGPGGGGGGGLGLGMNSMSKAAPPGATTVSFKFSFLTDQYLLCFEGEC